VKPSEINSILRGYFSIESKMAKNYKTLYEKVRRSFYLGISRNDVYKFMRNNPVNLKETRVTNDPLYVESYRPMYPFEHWQIDLIDFRNIAKYNEYADKRYYNFILVIIDIFSKFIYLNPIEGIYDDIEKTSLKMSREICGVIKKIFLSGDIPKKMGCDNQFNVKTFLELCQTFSVRPIFSMPHNPQTNGFVENKNKQIKGFVYHHFNRYYKESGFKYYDILDHIAYSINNTKHSVTQKTPNEIHRGRILPLPTTPVNVKNVPISFIKAFPVLENSFNPRQITHPSKMTQIDNDVTQDDNSVIQAYNDAAQRIYSERVDYVRNKLHNEASKREEAYKRKDSVKRFDTSSLVKVRTYLDVADSTNIQPIQLRLVSHDSKIILQNPLFRITTGMSINTIAHQKKPSQVIIKSQTEWKNMPEGLVSIFRIKEIVVFPNKTKKYYRLVTFDNKFTVEFITSKIKQDVKYSSNFTQQMLHHADYKDVQKEASYRPNYEEFSTNVSSVSTVDNNVILDDEMTNETFALKRPNSKYDYLANQNVKQLTEIEYTKFWDYIVNNKKFDDLINNEIIMWVKRPKSKNFTRVVGLLKQFIHKGKNKDHYYVTFYDGSEIIYNNRMVDLHTDNSLLYGVHGSELQMKGNEYIFRYPYYIRKLFDI
jgi:hypothetical protein